MRTAGRCSPRGILPAASCGHARQDRGFALASGIGGSLSAAGFRYETKKAGVIQCVICESNNLVGLDGLPCLCQCRRCQSFWKSSALRGGDQCVLFRPVQYDGWLEYESVATPFWRCRLRMTDSKYGLEIRPGDVNDIYLGERSVSGNYVIPF
jgi:hypothetical protein